MPEHQQMQQSKNPESSSQRRIIPASQSQILNPAAIIQRARINPKSLTSADVLQLQRTIGNRAVDRLLSEISGPSTGQQVPIQRQEISEEEEPLQGMFESKPEEEYCPSCIQRQEIPEEEEPLQGKFETVQRQEIPEEEEPLQKKSENNTGIPYNLKAGVESLSGIDMSDMRVHYNSSKPAEVGALAYTQGTNIYVSPGQERHLSHEAWDVVQQVQGRVRPTMQLKGVAVNDDVELEHEADEMGAHTLSAGVAMVTGDRTRPSHQAPSKTPAGTELIQKVEDLTYLDPLDLQNCTLPSSGRSGNTVLLGEGFVYKLFNNPEEYQREVNESIELEKAGARVLFYKGLEKRRVKFPDKSTRKMSVIMMYRAQGETYMLAKSGGVSRFMNVVYFFRKDQIQLQNLLRWFKAASDAGIKDAQFIYESETHTPLFIDVHLGGVKGGGDCNTIVQYIQQLLNTSNASSI